jgi:hypothetical protein
MKKRLRRMPQTEFRPDAAVLWIPARRLASAAIFVQFGNESGHGACPAKVDTGFAFGRALT